MFTSLTKKLTCPPKPSTSLKLRRTCWRRLGYTLTVFAIAFVPALHCFDMQREYSYLSILMHNSNAPAFTKQLHQLAASNAKTKTPEFHEMLKTLAHDIEHALLNAHAMHGADISGDIADNGYSQCKWGVGELVLAALLFKFHPERTQENAKLYFGMLAGSIGSGVLGLISLKNSVTNYFLARRYGKHIQTRLESLEEIKKQIAIHLSA